jgi:hypothetical protein
VPTPPWMPMNTGPLCRPAAAVAWISRTPSVREAWLRAAWKSCGTAERIEMRYASPA